jgi:carbon-monoxide dehydrogenase medium subunit
VKPAPFEYHAPETVDDVVALLREHGDTAKVLGGGQSLMPMLALRLTRFDHIVDLNRVDSLTGVDADSTQLRIGAMTRQRVLERDPRIAATAPLLAMAAPHIGHFQIRNRGTVGGSLAHADPASELPAVAMALDAEFTVSGRAIPAASFFVDTWTTVIADDELLTDIMFPVWTGDVRAAVHEVARRAGDFALAGAAVQVSMAEGRVTRAAIALFGVASTPLRATDAERALVEGADEHEVAELALRDADPTDDIHASATQRRRMGVSALRTALAELRTPR